MASEQEEMWVIISSLPSLEINPEGLAEGSEAEQRDLGFGLTPGMHKS